MRKTIVSSLILATLLIMISAGTVFADTTYAVHVQNAKSGQAISGATVYLLVYVQSINIPFNAVETDSNGNAVLSVPSGYTVSSWTVEANGYITVNANGSPPTTVQLYSINGGNSGNSTSVTVSVNVPTSNYYYFAGLMLAVTCIGIYYVKRKKKE